ncbi:MAG: nitroreductase family protein [Bacteroidales bacterium]|nr:nitroreductase family protein [Candidatus Physcousia equi]
MEQFSELVKVRRSMRKFTEEKITPEEQQQLMRAALMAPTSKGLHSYEFYVVEDSLQLQQLASAKDRGAEFMAQAPLAIVVAARPDVSDVWIEDASVAATTLLYQAEDMGLGACWVQFRERVDAEGNRAEENVRRIVGIPADQRIVCVVAIGHKGMERKPQNEERLLWDKVHS